MKWMLAITIAVLLLAGAASAHRMFAGLQVTIDLFVFYDDGSPAANVEVKLYQEDELFAQNVTDATGKFTIILPGKGTGKWYYEIEGGGHTEKGYINIDNNQPLKGNQTLQAGVLGYGILLPYSLGRRKRENGRERT